MHSRKLIIAGVGALGSEICRRLALISSPRVLMIDPDHMKGHNTPLSSIYQKALLTRSSKCFTTFKVDLIADIVKDDFSLIWEKAAIEFADVGLREMAGYDMVISCTDNALARVEASRAARILGLPMIDAGVMGNEIAQGRVAYFSPHADAACYLCGMTEYRRAEILAYAASPSLGCRTLEEAPSMTGTLETVRETAEALLTLLQQWQAGELPQPQSFAQRVILCGSQWRSESIALTRSITCPWHSDEDRPWCELNEDRPIREALHPPDLRAQLLWPQCLQARCRQCGYRSEPLRRVAWVRRKMICCACGASGTTEPLHVIETISHTDREADCTPRQLGLPKQHLYLLRHAFSPQARKDSDEPVV